MPGKHRKTKTSRPARVTETTEYAAMLERLIVRWGERIADDPAALVHSKGLQQALMDATNMGVFSAANKSHQPYSLAEMGRMMGVSWQAVQQRAGRGEAVYVQLQARRADGPVVRLADKQAERAALLAAAGVEDRTGSQRELAATGTDDPAAIAGRTVPLRPPTR